MKETEERERSEGGEGCSTYKRAVARGAIRLPTFPPLPVHEIRRGSEEESEEARFEASERGKERRSELRKIWKRKGKAGGRSSHPSFCRSLVPASPNDSVHGAPSDASAAAATTTTTATPEYIQSGEEYDGR